MVITGSRLNRLIYKLLPSSVLITIIIIAGLMVIIQYDGNVINGLYSIYGYGIFIFALSLLIQVIIDLSQICSFESKNREFCQVAIENNMLYINKISVPIIDIKFIKYHRSYHNINLSLSYYEIMFNNENAEIGKYVDYENRIYCLERYDLNRFIKIIFVNPVNTKLIKLLIDLGLERDKVVNIHGV
jgi:hypothetical protein